MPPARQQGVQPARQGKSSQSNFPKPAPAAQAVVPPPHAGSLESYLPPGMETVCGKAGGAELRAAAECLLNYCRGTATALDASVCKSAEDDLTDTRTARLDDSQLGMRFGLVGAVLAVVGDTLVRAKDARTRQTLLEAAGELVRRARDANQARVCVPPAAIGRVLPQVVVSARSSNKVERGLAEGLCMSIAEMCGVNFVHYFLAQAFQGGAAVAVPALDLCAQVACEFGSDPETTGFVPETIVPPLSAALRHQDAKVRAAALRVTEAVVRGLPAKDQQRFVAMMKDAFKAGPSNFTVPKALQNPAELPRIVPKRFVGGHPPAESATRPSPPPPAPASQSSQLFSQPVECPPSPPPLSLPTTL